MQIFNRNTKNSAIAMDMLLSTNILYAQMVPNIVGDQVSYLDSDLKLKYSLLLNCEISVNMESMQINGGI
jgi:hypothetical protein